MNYGPRFEGLTLTRIDGDPTGVIEWKAADAFNVDEQVSPPLALVGEWFNINDYFCNVYADARWARVSSLIEGKHTVKWTGHFNLI